MSDIYIYSERLDIAAELIGFARQNHKEPYVVTFSAVAAEELANLGANKVFYLKGESPLVENYAKQISKFLKEQAASHFMVGATARGRDLAARVAGYMDCGMASDLSGLTYVDDELICERIIYGGAVRQKEAFKDFCVVTVPGGLFEPVQGDCEIFTIDLKADERVVLVERTEIPSRGNDLPTASKVVCVGLGLAEEEDLSLVNGLVDVLEGEIACTRGIAEERHWLPVERYIGISGAVIKPELYIALGVSGQIQHVYGIRESKIIVAIDKNDKAPIFRYADYGIVGDMYEIIPLLTDLLN
ncbi:MAG: electron transfer flavoprotein subunit alpha/FixB family protein [Syntrophomonadaceae bacterium]|nr:electron transfer flavoprotein subunit alpha/FixB family protein [Syntrophomonadaceae bacterium]